MMNAKCEGTPTRTPHSDGGARAARDSLPSRLHPETDNDSNSWSIMSGSALMLEDLADDGGPATGKMPHATDKRIARRIAILPLAASGAGYRPPHRMPVVERRLAI